MKSNFIQIFISILVLNLPSCKNSTSLIDSIDKSKSPEIVPGQVVVGLNDTVSYSFVTSFFDSLNLEILDIDLSHNFWAFADSNDFELYQKIFSKNSTVEFIHKLSTYSTEDTLAITITFNGINTVQSDLIKIKSYGLTVIKINEHPKTVIFKSEEGKEKFWIEELIKYAFVKYAEYNYIVYRHG